MKYRTHRSSFLSLTLLTGVLTASAARIEPDLLQRLQRAGSATQEFPVDFVMKAQANALSLDPSIQDLPRPKRRARTGRMLMDFAQADQQELLGFLKAREAEGLVADVHPLWIVNSIGCRATRDVIYRVAQRSDVELVYYDPMPCELGELDLKAEPVPCDGIEPAMVVTNVRGAWNQGYHGEGVVLGVIDTGIRYTHADLANRLWQSAVYPNHGFNFASFQYSSGHPGPSSYDTLTPLDYYGHGTHVAGIAAADGTYGDGTHDTMGIAPAVKLMSLPVDVYLHSPYPDTSMENNTMQAMQFCIRPTRDTLNGADVINMSLGLLAMWQPRMAVWRAAEENVLAAGIVHTVPAGSEGPSSRTIRCPANCPPPWPNPENNPISHASSAVITVGATDNDDHVASFSSIGPSDWGNVSPYNDYVYPPGLTDPDLMMPGINILSAYYDGDQSYTIMSGTSMSTPAAAGVVCLMLSKNPQLTPLAIDSIIELYSARDLGPSGKDNTYGAGRINCSLAVAYTPTAGPRHDIALGSILAPDAEIEPAAPITPQVTVVNVGTYDEGVIPVHFKIDSGGTTIYNQTVNLPGLDSAMSDTAVFPDWTPGPGGNVYSVTTWHSYLPDTSRMNDTLHRTVTVRSHGISSVGMNVGGRVRAEQPFTPALTIRAADYDEHSVTCYCWIDSAGTRVYDQSTLVDSVPANGTAVATFPVWLVGPTGAQYEVTMFNTFADPNHADDTLHRATEATDQMRVLIAHADLGGMPDSLTRGLTVLGDSVELFDAANGTPTLTQLQEYDGVITFSNNTYANAAGLGDVLADYIDVGHPVVLATFAVTNGWELAGRLMSGDYATMVPGFNTLGQDTLGWYNAAHPIMSGVTMTTDYYRSATGFAAGADSVAKWRDSKPYVATSANMRVVAINNYPGYYSPERLAGEWVLVYHNALLWASGGGSGLEEKQPFSISPDFTLCQSKPNPFRDRTVISYSVPRALDVSIGVYDLSGRLVTTLVSGNQPAGRHNVTWNRTDGTGNRVASGVYFYKLTSGNYCITRKLVVE